MGLCLAAAAISNAARVLLLIKRPVQIQHPLALILVPSKSANDMLAAVRARHAKAKRMYLLVAAAVAEL